MFHWRSRKTRKIIKIEIRSFRIGGWIRWVRYIIVSILSFVPKFISFFSFHFRGAAKNTFYLKKAGVTHVLNTAEGTRQGLVDTNQNFYRPFGIKYKGLKLLDVAQTNIAMYFSEVAEFIDEALQSGGKYQIIWKQT